MTKPLQERIGGGVGGGGGREEVVGIMRDSKGWERANWDKSQNLGRGVGPISHSLSYSGTSI